MPTTCFCCNFPKQAEPKRKSILQDTDKKRSSRERESMQGTSKCSKTTDAAKKLKQTPSKQSNLSRDDSRESTQTIRRTSNAKLNTKSNLKHPPGENGKDIQKLLRSRPVLTRAVCKISKVNPATPDSNVNEYVVSMCSKVNPKGPGEDCESEVDMNEKTQHRRYKVCRRSDSLNEEPLKEYKMNVRTRFNPNCPDVACETILESLSGELPEKSKSCTGGKQTTMIKEYTPTKFNPTFTDEDIEDLQAPSTSGAKNPNTSMLFSRKESTESQPSEETLKDFKISTCTSFNPKCPEMDCDDVDEPPPARAPVKRKPPCVAFSKKNKEIQVDKDMDKYREKTICVEVKPKCPDPDCKDVHGVDKLDKCRPEFDLTLLQCKNSKERRNSDSNENNKIIVDLSSQICSHQCGFGNSDTHIKLLQERITSSSDNTLSRRIQDEQLKRALCEDIINKLQKRILDIQEDLAVARNEVIGKESIIDKLQSSYLKLTQKVSTIRDESSNQNIQVNERAEQLEKENNALKEKIQQQVIEFKRSKASKAAEANEKDKTIEVLKDSINKYEEIIREKNAANDELNEANKKVLRKNKQISDNVSNLQMIVNTITGGYRAAKEQNKHAEEIQRQNEATIVSLQEELKELHDQLEPCNNQVACLRKQIQQQQAILLSTVKKCSLLEKKYAEVKCHVDSEYKDIKAHYQDQLETIVVAKLQEFQEELDNAKRKMLEEVKQREVCMNQQTQQKLQQIKKHHNIELMATKQNGEETELNYKTRLTKANEVILQLETKLSAFKKKNSEVAYQLQAVMKNQWLEALKIITHGAKSTSSISTAEKSMHSQYSARTGESCSGKRVHIEIEESPPCMEPQPLECCQVIRGTSDSSCSAEPIMDSETRNMLVEKILKRLDEFDSSLNVGKTTSRSLYIYSDNMNDSDNTSMVSMPAKSCEKKASNTEMQMQQKIMQLLDKFYQAQQCNKCCSQSSKASIFKKEPLRPAWR